MGPRTTARAPRWESMVRRSPQSQATRKPWRLALWTSVLVVVTLHSRESRGARLATLAAILSADLKRGFSQIEKGEQQSAVERALSARLIFVLFVVPPSGGSS